MLAIPLQCDPLSYDLFIVLEDENIERIKAYDPGEMITSNLADVWQKLKVRNIILLYATTEEAQRIGGAASLEDVIAQLKNLSRGFKYRPDKGDSNAPYQSPVKN